MLTARPRTCGIRSMRSAPRKRGSRNAERGTERRPLPPGRSPFCSAFRLPRSAFLARQRHGHVPDDLERRRTHLVYRILRRMPVAVAGTVVEVHDVDGMDAGLLEGDVVVDEGRLDLRNEVPLVAERARGAPDAVHHLRRERLGVAFVADRSEEHTSELQSPCNLVC